MDSLQKHTYVLILAGGGGTRLWPRSRDTDPKQFLKLFSGKSLFQLVLERAETLTTPENIFVNTSEKYAKIVRQEAKKVPAENIITEPMRRDTAFAEGVGAAYIYHRDPEAVIFNFPSDHLIGPLNVFSKQMLQVAKVAKETNQFVTVGISPTYPNTGLGHIRARKPWSSESEDVLIGEKFVEKPPLELAEKYTESGEYYWNAHLFVWKAKLFLDLLKTHAPKTYAFLPKIIESIGTDKERATLVQAYQMAPTVATDYAVAEKLKKFICVPAKFDWSDVGDWSEMWKKLPKDVNGNVVIKASKIVTLDSENNLIIGDKRLIALSNVKNMIVVDTGDAILVCPKKESQSVKKIVELLKEKEMKDYL